MFLVVWCKQLPQGASDHFEAFDTYIDALERYQELCAMDDTFTCSIAQPIVSTDYDCAPVQSFFREGKE